MIQYSVALPDGYLAIEPLVEVLAADEGVVAREMGTLRTIPGSRHWHLAGRRGSGTVEITFDPARRCVVLAVHANRRGAWAGDEAVSRMAETLQRLAGRQPAP